MLCAVTGGAALLTLLMQNAYQYAMTMHTVCAFALTYLHACWSLHAVTKC